MEKASVSFFRPNKQTEFLHFFSRPLLQPIEQMAAFFAGIGIVLINGQLAHSTVTQILTVGVLPMGVQPAGIQSAWTKSQITVWI